MAEIVIIAQLRRKPEQIAPGRTRAQGFVEAANRPSASAGRWLRLVWPKTASS